MNLVLRIHRSVTTIITFDTHYCYNLYLGLMFIGHGEKQRSIESHGGLPAISAPSQRFSACKNIFEFRASNPIMILALYSPELLNVAGRKLRVEAAIWKQQDLIVAI